MVARTIAGADRADAKIENTRTPENLVVGDSSYRLLKHVSFCLANSHYIFLDLRNDEYLCLGRADTKAMALILNCQGALGKTSPGASPKEAADAERVLEALVAKGLLTESESGGKSPAPTSIAAPSASLMEIEDRHRPVVNPTHAWNFAIASLVASFSLRWVPIERIVHQIEYRKCAMSRYWDNTDQPEITPLFQIFRSLRPFYPRPYLCMFESLALLHFLAHYGLFPQWVYGVKAEPFAAHCWVQIGETVVNDIMENVRGYTPIMSA